MLEHVDASPTGGNTVRDQFLTDHIETIDAIEALTGIDFFPDLDPLAGRTEAAVELFEAPALWPR